MAEVEEVETVVTAAAAAVAPMEAAAMVEEVGVTVAVAKASAAVGHLPGKQTARLQLPTRNVYLATGLPSWIGKACTRQPYPM